MQKIILAACLGAALPAIAQTAEPNPVPEHSLSGNVGVVSQYVFRGLSQTNGKPAVQGGVDYTHASGLYVGTWLSISPGSPTRTPASKTRPSLWPPQATSVRLIALAPAMQLAWNGTSMPATRILSRLTGTTMSASSATTIPAVTTIWVPIASPIRPRSMARSATSG